ncbi:MAG TPA: sulfite exporter TauE/SafE family protein [Cyclobacteriaceae bacterium]|nr:sulfite exporter TauE/SafE family protein [Cyclobacteriaceae bacterium]
MLSEIIGYLSAIVVGFVLGLLGGGGSILSIPILVYLFNIEPALAGAYSLFIVGVTSFAGAIPKYKQQLVHLKTGIVFGLPSIVSIFLTRSFIVPAIPEEICFIGSFLLTKRILLLGLFAILMVLASIPMIRGKRDIASDSKRFRTVLVILEGILIGFLTGLVGAGGGFLIIPALVFLTGLHFKTAVGTSLFIISVNSMSGFLGDALHHEMNWPLLLSLTALAVLGIFIGNHYSRKISGIRLRMAFGWFTLVIGVYILIREAFL